MSNLNTKYTLMAILLAVMFVVFNSVAINSIMSEVPLNSEWFSFIHVTTKVALIGIDLLIAILAILIMKIIED